MAVGRARRNAQDLGRPLAGQPREVAQLDQAGLEGVSLRESDEGRVQGQKFLVRRGSGGEVKLQLLPASAAAVNDALFVTGTFDQDAPHGVGRGREEMAAVVPTGGVGGFDEPQIRLVDEGRRVQGVAGSLRGHPGGRQFSQLLVHQGQQLPGGVGVAVGAVGQNAADFVHRRSPECTSPVQDGATAIFWRVWEW
jgi:hypothetical protein